MKAYQKLISKGLMALIFASSASVALAQGTFSVGTDVVSSYVWRGFKQDATAASQSPNIQPTVSYAIGKFTIGSWGSTSFTGTVKEVDLYATYAFTDKIGLTLTDYNWGFTKSYFKYNDGTDHVFEATLSYAGTEALPLSASVNTMFAGNDKKANGDQSYSTYVELGYQLAPEAKVFAGGLVNDGGAYGSKAGISNVGMKVTKSLAITDKFSLPVYGIFGVNPVKKDAFLVVGLTL